MMKTSRSNQSYLRARRNSFIYAYSGLRSLLETEPNARIHLLVTGGVITLGACLSISLLEWAALWIVMGLVWVAELFNTCIEKIMDLVHPERDRQVGIIKDLAAAAVLCTVLIAVGVGCFIFLPHL